MEVSTMRREEAVAPPRARLMPAPSPRLARSEVMAILRDEMRAPLLGLEALLDALAGPPLSAEVSERMQSHSRVLAQRVSLLIEDLALVSAQETSTVSMDLQELDLDTELAACAESFPDVLVRVEGHKGLTVRADRLRLQQICANLMRGSQRRGGRPVTIRVSGGTGFVGLRIMGAGKPDGHELAIVTMLVQAHGGTAVVDAAGSLNLNLPRAGSLTGLPVAR